MKNIYRLASGLVLIALLFFSGCIVYEKEKLTAEQQLEIQKEKATQQKQLLDFTAEMGKMLIILLLSNIILVWILPLIAKRNKWLRKKLGWERKNE